MLSYKQELSKYKDIQHQHLSEDDNINLKKKHKEDNPWILEYHYKENNSVCKWWHGWHKKDSYKTLVRATQALEQLKKSHINSDMIDDYRIYNIREGVPDDGDN